VYPILPTSSIATGAGVNGPVFVNKSVEFVISPINSIGATFEDTYAVQVNFTILIDFEILLFNNSYVVNYTAKESGNCSISVLLNGQHISNSPFTIIVGGTFQLY